MTFWVCIYIIGKENKVECGCHQPKKKEVARMVEKYILQLLILSIYFNVLQAILAIALIIALAIKLRK